MARVDLHNSNALMAAYHQSKTMPPRITRSSEDDYPDTRAIPGFGGVRRERERLRGLAAKRPTPGSYQPGRRGQTKPTPGSYYGRKKPRLN
jgi:hypothetical protein